MRKLNFMLIALFGFSITLSAQNAPIDFEAGGFGADWTWAVFENDTNPPLEIIANPDPSGANTSATVAQFTALATGAPFAGCESMLATDLGVYTLSEENSIVKIMVWKTNMSNVGIKMVTTSLGALPELLVPNTVTNQWEEITFDFSDYIDNAIYAIEDVAQIVIFPDFMDRDEDHVSYFDNITIGDGSSTGSDPCPDPDAIICDNFDDYALDMIAGQAAHWADWPGGSTSSMVSAEQAFSNTQSLNVAEGGVEDQLLLLGDQTTGVWSVDFMMYVPAGSNGYYNMQNTEATGQWNFDIFFNTGGAGDYQENQVSITPFTFPEDQWFEMSHTIDLNNLVVTIELDGAVVHTGPYIGDQVGCVNFYSIDATNNYFIDDVIVNGNPNVGVIEYTESAFTVYPNPTESMLTISGDQQIDAVVIRDILGAVVRQLNTPFSSQVTLDVADLTKGVYFVEVRVGDVVNVSRMIKN